MIRPVVQIDESLRTDMVVIDLDGFWMVELFHFGSHAPDLFLCLSIMINNDSNLEELAIILSTVSRL
jgi:hypothetical protein